MYFDWFFFYFLMFEQNIFLVHTQFLYSAFSDLDETLRFAM